MLRLQYGYRMSKTALNMAGKLLAEDLAAQDIPVGIVHPGPVSSTLAFHGAT
jgi:NAD(P)-dependent dehydrogenase (short-subunit alcohol dehydrogenase family)